MNLTALSSDKLPEKFLSRMRKLLTEKEYAAFLSSYGQERLFSLRLNPLKCSRETFLQCFPTSEGLEKEGKKTEEGAEEVWKAGGSESVPLRPVLWEPDGFYYPPALRPGKLPWHEAGMYYIQEASAMVPAVLLGARPGERVLDLCAAPGGKSTKLAACLQGRGLLVANEIHPERARILSANLERMGVRNAVVTNETPQRLASRFPLFFDRIAVDAPCSGEGMFRKEEEALVHWSPENVSMCALRQLEILEEAAAMLKRGGTLVYSTCTFSPEENEGVIARFLAAHPEFAPVDVWTLPANEPEAGEAGSVRVCPQPGIDSEASEAEPVGVCPQPGIDLEALEAEPVGACPQLGIAPEKWGFERGRPQWAGLEGWDDPEEGGARACGEQPCGAVNLREAVLKEGGALACAGLSSCSVRLWPHRIPGEGHFAAVLRKKDGAVREVQAKDACAVGLSGKNDAYYGIGAAPGKKKREKRGGKGSSAFAKEYAGRQNGQKNRGGERDPKRAQALQLWNEFREEALKIPGVLFPEENILLFGETLYALPVPSDSLPLDGLRVVRPGLALGDVKKGRFTPAHALAMALKRQEAAQSVSLSGRSPEAYSWIRGETIRTCRADMGGGTDCGEGFVLKKGWVLVTIDGCSIGWGKIAENPSDDGTAMVKNHYPKGLRRGNWLQAAIDH